MSRTPEMKEKEKKKKNDAHTGKRTQIEKKRRLVQCVSSVFGGPFLGTLVNVNRGSQLILSVSVTETEPVPEAKGGEPTARYRSDWESPKPQSTLTNISGNSACIRGNG